MPAIARQLAIDTQTDVTRRIAAFMRGFSLEAMKLDLADLHALKAALPAGTSVYLPAMPGREPGATDRSRRAAARDRLRAGSASCGPQPCKPRRARRRPVGMGSARASARCW